RRRLRREGRDGMPRLHARRHAASFPDRVRALRREGHARGRPDRRLRKARRRARPAGGLARRLDLEGALPRRGKEDDGLRARRGLRLGAPRRDPLPTGGGTGLIGMWKAFEEMESLGWIGERRPRMISVQAAGCAPIPKAFTDGKPVSEKWQNAETYAS